METIILNIVGMHCGGCVGSVKKALEAVAGVQAADLALAPGTAAVTFDPALTGTAALARAVVEAGYAVRSGSGIAGAQDALPVKQCGGVGQAKTGCGCG